MVAAAIHRNGTREMMSVGHWIRVIAVAFLALFFLVAPVYSLLEKGPFSWHVKQPEAWQGGGEVLALAAIFYGALSLPWERIRVGLLLLFGWLYARRHGVDLSIILVYLYVEGMLTLGWLLLPRIGLARFARPATLLVAGLLGVIAWSLVIWMTSAVGIGSPAAVRLIALAVLGLCILLSRGPRLGVVLLRAAQGRGRLERLFAALIAAFFLALFAKASVMVDYDSLWYGLQAEEVLVGEGSLYASQGLASVTHYYPKLYEALQLPFAGLGSVSLIFGVGILSWLMVVITGSAILREFNVPKNVRIWGASLIATLPAVANIAVTAKGDVFSAWLMMMAMLGLVRFRKNQGWVWFWISLCSIPLALMARLTNLPYGAILTFLLAISVVQQWKRNKVTSPIANSGIWLAAATALLVALVTARTIILAGVPLIAPNPLVRFAQSLGFDLKYPIGLLPEGEGLPEFPVVQGLWSFLFDPASLPHIIITWPGNVWAYLAMAVLLLARTRSLHTAGAWPLLAVGLSFFGVLFGYKHPVAGGDGNYFIFPIICLTLWGCIRSAELNGSSRRLLAVLALLFAITAASIAFVTGSWGPGSRALDSSLTRMPFEYAQRASQGIASVHMQGVERYFKALPAGTRVVGLESVDLNAALPSGWWLPVRYEPLQAYAWQQPELVNSSSNFQDYLRRAQIEYVVVPKKRDGGAVEKVVLSALQALQSSGLAEHAYQDSYYVVWKLKTANAIAAQLLGGGTVSVIFPPDEICAGNSNVVAVVTWSATASPIAIEVKSAQSANASLWAEVGNQGQLSTGPWISPDSEFIFRRGRGGDIMGVVKVAPECRP